MRLLLLISLITTCTGCGSSSPDVDAIKQHMTSEQLELGPPLANSANMIMVPIPAGEFMMGTKEKKENPQTKPETPQHRVKISKPYYMSAFEVTQGQYEAVMSEKPWAGKPLVQEGENYAATYISWKKAAEFCRKLSEQENANYRLPTEAEWEYACRARSLTTYSFGVEPAKLSEHAWYSENAYKNGQQYPHRVGQKTPNAWAMFDMHGNTWEWCHDYYAKYDAKKTISVDPKGPKKSRTHVWRGGSFADGADNSRSATRLSYSRQDYQPEYLTGFRVVRSFEGTP
ncbi:MAG: formylglycine-generating enzyme family protein [Pirellulales bacterium]